MPQRITVMTRIRPMCWQYTRFTLTLGLLTLSILSSSRAAELSVAPVAPARPFPLETRSVVDALGRQITYYVSHPAKQAPIMLMIQGSGCYEVLKKQPAGYFSTFYGLLRYAGEGKFVVLAVEKPFAGQPDGARSGTASECSARFNADFTAESWLVALQAALAEVRRLTYVDPSRTLLFGESEGAGMAAMLAGHDTSITDVIAIGGSGET